MINKWKKSFFRLSFVLTIIGTNFYVAANAQSPAQTFPPNQPIGTGKGCFPGRVTWIRDAQVARWDGINGHWWDEGNIDQDVLDRMYARSLCELTGTRIPSKAWNKLFKHYNLTHGRGNRGWKKGEDIAVKINLNNTFSTDDKDNEIDQSPQATRALLRQLTKEAGIPQKNIIIYDASIGFRARAIPDRIRMSLRQEFPNVRWMSANGSEEVESAQWVENAITYSSPEVRLGNRLPRAVVEASYLINAALLKGHELSGVTLCAKNHFGSIPFPVREHNSTTVHQMKGQEGDYSAFVDLMGCPNLGAKTILYIVDGIYGMQTNVGEPLPQRDRWRHLFDGEWSACYFMSQDPVAIECVCMDFLFAEFGTELGFSGAPAFPKGAYKNCDNYLKEAARGSNHLSGPYCPNGVETGSLGVFEHWNNEQDKQYSRNLGKEEGIELIQIK